MEIVKTILSWLWENIFDIALVIVGASAFITYLLQVRNERKTAAALIIEQIDCTYIYCCRSKRIYKSH